MFDNRALRRIFGPKRDQVTENWRRLHNQELYDPYSLQNIIQVMKSRRMRWTAHVARIGDRRDVYTVLMERPEERGHLKDQSV
jgi:hypothetical protein